MTTARLEATPLDTPWSLLTAKLTVPKPRDVLVPRRRLFDRLSAGVARPLTIISGPPGAGKTTLVASWIAQELAPGPVAWLTLDKNDDQPGVFWSYVAESLRRHGVPLPAEIGQPLHPGGVERSFLELLAQAMADRYEPAILVLDQFESISSPALLRDLDFVLTHSSPELRLVLTTRAEPGAFASRHLLRAELSSIRTADLAFRPEEAESLLGQYGVRLPPEMLAALEERLEGWAAGLRLCAAALRDREATGFIEALPWGQVGLADYLVEEVLDSQPGPVQDFLLKTSVVDRICPELANALTGAANGAEMLEALAKQNALVEMVGEGYRWHRYHPLLAEVLQAELRRRQPGAVSEQHLRAAQWYAAHGEDSLAATQASAAGDWASTCAGIVRRLGVIPLLEGRAPAELVRVVRAIPADADAAMIDLVRAAEAVAAADVGRAGALVDRAQAGADEVPAEDRAAFDVVTGLVRLVVARRLLDEATARAACADLEHGLSRIAAPVEARDRARAVGLASLAGAQLWAGNFEAAEPALWAALAAGRRPGCEYALLTVLGQLALWAYRNGELREAARLGQEALDLSREAGLPGRHQTGVGHLALSMVALEWTDLPAARRHLADADLTAEAATDPALGAIVRMLQAFHLAVDGHRAEALTTLAELRTSADNTALPAWMRTRIAVAEAAVRLRCADPEGALLALERAPARSDDWHLTRAGVAYALGDLTTARQLVDPMLSGGQSVIHGGVVEAMLLSARLHLDRGDTARARRLIEDALHTARPEGRRRPFLEAASWLRPLIADSADLKSAAGWVGGSLQPPRTGRTMPVDIGTLLVDPLTERERAVLSRMALAMSAADIAADLHLSINTVKSHQKNLYRKLSVRRANDAVRRGRELQLV
ncbi:MAG: LuxR C-terminal-related transcriptional regulator [Nocardioides sp.]